MKDVEPERTGQIEHLLTVEVIDYHATTLRLPWKDVQALVTIASGLPRPRASKSRSKRNPPPEV